MKRRKMYNSRVYQMAKNHTQLLIKRISRILGMSIMVLQSFVRSEFKYTPIIRHTYQNPETEVIGRQTRKLD